MIKVLKSFDDKSVCILGLGYVGLTLAIVMADVGFNVHGVEVREDVLEKLSKGTPHFHEPGLSVKLKRVVESKKLTFSKSIPLARQHSVYIVTVGTPLDKNKKSRMDMIENVSHEIAQHIKEGDLIIMRSTVKLGTTRNIVMPILQKTGVNFELAFCPERTLEGNALKELYSLPQIVGGTTKSATVRASQIFQYITPTVIRVSDVETAEMIKLIDNAQRDVMFAYANEVARACDVVGISATEVIRFGGLGYPRSNLSVPGPVGGPCLAKDSHILAEGLLDLGITPEITLMARKINERQPEESVQFIKKYTKTLKDFPRVPKISLLGLAFKGQPETDDLRGTMAIPVLEAIKNHFPNAILYGYDPIVSREAIHGLGLVPCHTLQEAMMEANIVLILNNHPVFTTMPIEDYFHYLASSGFVYDYWNLFSTKKLNLPIGRNYIGLGSHGHSVKVPA